MSNSGLQKCAPNTLVSTFGRIDAHHSRTELAFHARKICIDLVKRIAIVAAVIALQSVAEPLNRWVQIHIEELSSEIGRTP